jgi:hypothetical protein
MVLRTRDHAWQYTARCRLLPSPFRGILTRAQAPARMPAPVGYGALGREGAEGRM